MSNETNVTTARSSGWGSRDSATHSLEQRESRDKRWEVYDNVGITVGSIIVAFNLFIIISFIVSKCCKIGSLSRRMSLSLVALTVFGLFHGFIFSGVYVYLRRNRREMDEQLCLLTTLVIDFCEHFMLILLLLVAIERFIIVYFPFMSKKKRTVIVTIFFILDLIAAVLIAWLPLVPGLALREPGYQTGNSAVQQSVNSFQRAFTCNDKLNKRNWISPYLLISLQVICSLGVTVLMILNHWRIKTTVEKLGNLKNEEKDLLKKGAMNVGIISAVVIVVTMPYAINEMVRNDCDILFDTATKRNSCSAWGLELRFAFRIIFHTSDFFGPFLFTMLDPKIRADLRYFSLKALTCGKYQGKPGHKLSAETEMQTQTVWDNDTKLDDASSSGSLAVIKSNDDSKTNGHSNGI